MTTDVAATGAENAPASATALFSGIAAGSHAVQIWVRGSATTCALNKGNFGNDLLVEEFN